MSAETKTQSSGDAAVAGDSNNAGEPPLKTYTLEQIAEHNKEDDLWVVLDARVYDITNFVQDHPGGGDVLYDVAGTDATEAFEDIFHSESAREQLPEYLIGQVEGQTPGRNDAKNKTLSDDPQNLQFGILFVLVFAVCAAIYQVYFIQGRETEFPP